MIFKIVYIFLWFESIDFLIYCYLLLKSVILINIEYVSPKKMFLFRFIEKIGRLKNQHENDKNKFIDLLI